MIVQHRVHLFADIRNKVECIECGYKDNDKNVKHHIKLKHPESDIKCLVCEYTAKTTHKMQAHWAAQHPGMVILNKNYRPKHKLPKETQTRECDVCHVQVKMAKYKMHMRKHDPTRLRCDLCNFQGQFPFQVKKHQQQKHGLNKYSCDKCQQTFTQESSLRFHLKVSTTPHRRAV